MTPLDTKEPLIVPEQLKTTTDDDNSINTKNNNIAKKLTKKKKVKRINKPVISRYGRKIKSLQVADNKSFHTSLKSSKILKENQGLNSDMVKSDGHDHKTENGVVNDDKIKSITAVVNSNDNIKKKENIENNVSVPELLKTESPDAVDDKSKNDCIEEEKMEVVDNDVKSISGKSIKWSVGQLTWAHISHYPYWPCIITLEPNTDIFTKKKSKYSFFNNKKKIWF